MKTGPIGAASRLKKTTSKALARKTGARGLRSILDPQSSILAFVLPPSSNL